MKILLVAEVSIAQVIGGAERVLREQALGLAARGHSVHILTRMPPGDTEERVDVEGVAEYRYPVVRSNPVSFFLSSMRNARRTCLALAHERLPDVMLIHQPLSGLAAAGCLPGVPSVYTCLSLAHEEFETRNRPPAWMGGLMWHRCQSLARRKIEQRMLSRAQRVIVLSDFMRRRVADCHLVPRDRILLFPAGVDTQFFSPAMDYRSARAALGLAREDFVLFTVRNLVPRMGLKSLLDAMPILRKEIPQIRLLIGGSGPLRAELEAQVKSLALGDCVRLLGFVPEAQLPAHYRAADLFVLPTAQIEGFGLVTIEALASGTPVVGTPIGATSEILGGLDASLLTRGADAESLAAGIAALYRRFTTDPGGRARLSEAGRALVLRDYTWGRHCEQIESVLKQACTGAHAFPRNG
jgi:glycosyltransferase involved in cell wall biosynthesis